MRRSTGFFILFLITFISVIWFSGQADAQTGGLKYTVTVTKFENKAGWHHRVPTDEEYNEAILELNQRGILL